MGDALHTSDPVTCGQLLAIVDDIVTPRTYALTGEICLIGRAASCDILV
jgi:hypothetical protein